MKGFFVFCLATAIISVSSSKLQSVSELNKEFARNNSGRQPRVVEGQVTSDGQFPYQALLVLLASSEEDAAVVGWCGGTIVAEQWVLTTGHCLTLCNDECDATVFYVGAGSIRAGDQRQKTVVPYSNTYLHPEFDPDSFMNDIALLKTGGFDFSTPFVQAVPMVAADTDSASYEGLYITTSGFGYTSDAGPTSDQVLFTHYLTVIGRDVCLSQYAEDAVPATAFCAQDYPDPVTAACYGDAGGPAVMQMDGVMTLVGCTSFGMKGGCSTAAQGFTDIAQVREWIDETMANN